MIEVQSLASIHEVGNTVVRAVCTTLMLKCPCFKFLPVSVFTIHQRQFWQRKTQITVIAKMETGDFGNWEENRWDFWHLGETWEAVWHWRTSILTWVLPLKGVAVKQLVLLKLKLIPWYFGKIKIHQNEQVIHSIIQTTELDAYFQMLSHWNGRWLVQGKQLTQKPFCFVLGFFLFGWFWLIGWLRFFIFLNKNTDKSLLRPRERAQSGQCRTSWRILVHLSVCCCWKKHPRE